MYRLHQLVFTFVPDLNMFPGLRRILRAFFGGYPMHGGQQLHTVRRLETCYQLFNFGNVLQQLLILTVLNKLFRLGKRFLIGRNFRFDDTIAQAMNKMTIHFIQSMAQSIGIGSVMMLNKFQPQIFARFL